MAHHINGRSDKYLKALIQVLEKYASQHPRCQIEAFRRGPYAIWVRIIDPDFAGLSRKKRHDVVSDLLEELPEKTLSHVSLLLLLTPKERKKSLVSLEFDDPVAAKV